MGLTRRRFLMRAAAAGGASLMYEAMTGLGLLAMPAQTRFELSGKVSGTRVLVLGAGLSGLTLAYELGKVGYHCRVLEGRARPGGRVFTVRRGTVSEEEGSTQTAAFDDGLYFNAGPMRISHHHHTTLAYCQELQVAVEPFVVDSESAYVYQTQIENSERPPRPFARGSRRSEAPAALQALAPLRQPDGRVYFAGDYMTDMSSWMNGAFDSAREVATALHARVARA